MPSQIEKLQAHTGHLLDLFIRLRERYALLDPMLFRTELREHFNSSGARWYGFSILLDSLTLSCAQDIAKIAFDDDVRTPSIAQLVQTLKDDFVRTSLRERFVVWNLPRNDEFKDPEVIAALKRIELREENKRDEQFEEILATTNDIWATFSKQDCMIDFKTIRDKITAHSEIRLVADKYQPVDMRNFGIKWNDFSTSISTMQLLIENLNLLIRNASFAWDMLDENLRKQCSSFWSVPLDLKA